MLCMEGDVHGSHAVHGMGRAWEHAFREPCLGCMGGLDTGDTPIYTEDNSDVLHGPACLHHGNAHRPPWGMTDMSSKGGIMSISVDIGNGLAKGAHAVAHFGMTQWTSLTNKVGITGARLIAGGLAALVSVTGVGLANGQHRFDDAICLPGQNVVVSAAAVRRGTKTTPGPNAANTVGAAETAKRIYAILAGLGMKDEDVAGILGNGMVESGGLLDPRATQGRFADGADNDEIIGKIGGSGHAIGIFQWDSNRATGLVNFAKSKGKQWYDLDVQLEYMLTKDSGKDVLLDMIRNPKGSVAAATEYFEVHWERPADAGATLVKRTEYANTWFAQMGGWSADPDAAKQIAGGLVDGVAGGQTGANAMAGKNQGQNATNVAYNSRCTPCTGGKTGGAAAQTASTGGGNAPTDATALSFITKYGDDINNVAEKYNIPAVVIIAQAGLESSYGTAGMAVKANNPWNFGAEGALEGLPGYLGAGESNSDFTIASFDSVPNAANGYGVFLASGPRYSAAFDKATDPKGFVQALQDAGYDRGGAAEGYAARISALFDGIEAAAKQAGKTLYLPSKPGNIFAGHAAQEATGGTAVNAGLHQGNSVGNCIGLNRKTSGYPQGKLGAITDECTGDPRATAAAKQLKPSNSAIMTEAENYMIGIACNNNVGYSQSHQPPLTLTSPTDTTPQNTDCSDSIAWSLRAAGWRDSALFFTGNEASVLEGNGFTRMPFGNDTSKLEAGDILISGGHTVMYLGNNMDAAAHISENGTIYGQAGDQTKQEVSVSFHDTDPSLSVVYRYEGNKQPTPVTKA